MAARLASNVLAIALLSAAGCSNAEPGDTKRNENSIVISPAEKAPTMTAVQIVSGSRRWIARIDDGPAARDFLAQLPLELTLEDYGGNEKIADLPRPLTRKGAPGAITHPEQATWHSTHHGEISRSSMAMGITRQG
ncbi:hypothetical protein LQ953_03360 [Sphingomonas sp. IC-56]|uniref:cyclophilin-like fold protein n=1 Tax=Sphingomonas sp. IC-56 TaxID=2898529 RepID=UPI001E618CA6|nr:cyclophilin-like fold protein [Sphingomonas sp. IC-56]MCD2323050.1 hypothetical protein [Sphingomonas sp. IC-56]